jgi:hypothetical protein
MNPRVQELAARWALKSPELASRIARALPLTQGVTMLTAGFWAVNNGGDVCLVNMASCECKDAQSGHKCKHVLAVALVFASQEPKPRCMRRKIWHLPG